MWPPAQMAPGLEASIALTLISGAFVLGNEGWEQATLLKTFEFIQVGLLCSSS